MKIRFIFLGLAMMLTVSQLAAQESKFKALFIYKFAEYIEWPGGLSKVTVGIAGTSDVFTELSNFAASKDNIEVIKISSPADAGKCQIIFLPKSESSKVGSYDQKIGGTSVLLISDDQSMAGKGADIGFYTEGGKLRFLISEGNIRDKKMIPNSKLLVLGKAI